MRQLNIMNTNTNKSAAVDAIRLLDSATHPANAGKLSRADYANINLALQVLADFVEANSENPPEQPDKT